MIRVGISGCNGSMGRVLTEMINEIDDMEIVFGIDKRNDLELFQYEIYDNPLNVKIESDVIIDFSNPIGISDLLKHAVKTKTPLVIATTGLNQDDESNIEDASKYIPIFKSSNTSLGINLILDLVKKATNILGSDFDIEIVEKHHKKKVDAPSGTAYMIANEINMELNNSMSYRYGREGNEVKRTENEIGIHAVRGGTIAGEHTVIFAGTDEIIEIKHTALSKKIFARGAINSARFILNKKPMIYSMKNIIEKKE